MSIKKSLLASTALGVSIAWALPAASQEPTEVQEVVVTGTRVGVQGFDTPTPTQVLSTEMLQQRGATNVGDFLNELPAFRPSTNNQVATNASTGQAAQVFADLRALGSIRTLTLIDGRRVVPSSATGQVDLNLVPTVLVDRIDVVTGGVSAVYGSDALAGVVNVILAKHLEGIRGEVSTGISQHGDNFERRWGLAAGAPLSDGRGHIVFGGEYVKSDGIGSYLDRDWGRRNDERYPFPRNRPAGTPAVMYAYGVQQVNSPRGGVVNGSCATLTCNPTALSANSPLRGIGFNPDGSLYPFSYGNDTLNTGNSYDFTSDGELTRPILQIALPVNRYSTALHADYDIMDSMSFYVDGLYARSGDEHAAARTRDQRTTGIIIRRDNAFLPDALAAIMDTNNVQSISLGRSNSDWNQSHPKSFNTTAQITAGLEGKLFENWNWNVYASYGQNTFDSMIGPIRIENNYKFAQDAVYYNPTSNAILANPSAGVPAGYVIGCRALVPGSATYNPIAAAGCEPMDLFGDYAPSAASLDYVNGTVIQQITTELNVFAGELSGDLFDTWAGPVSVAAGAEYRKERDVGKVDELSRVSAFNYSNPQPYQGNMSVKEGYGEILVPLAKDLSFARSIDFNGAVRYTDYSFSGTIATWKLGGTWEAIDGLTLRGTVSHDIRAPNASELFQNSEGHGPLLNPFSGVVEGTAIYNLPSPSLQPEKSNTKTLGFVLGPKLIPGLNLSVDYYDITVNGAISTLSTSLITNGCVAELASAAGAGYFCSFYNRTGNEVNYISVQRVNLASLGSSGVDFNVSYRIPVGPGSVTARLFGTYVEHLKTDDGLGNPLAYDGAGVIQTKGSVVDHAGQVGGGVTSEPHWQVNSSFTYAVPRWSATVQGRYVEGGHIDNTLVGPDDPAYDAASPISIGDNNVKSRIYVNLSGTYNIIDRDGGQKLQAYMAINNVTNVDPPFPSTAVSGFYDHIGRYFRAGLRFSL
jgi:iron complex outermembrane recepter protein